MTSWPIPRPACCFMYSFTESSVDVDRPLGSGSSVGARRLAKAWSTSLWEAPALARPGAGAELLPELPVAGQLVRKRGVGEGLDQVLDHADGHGAADDVQFTNGRDGDDVREEPCSPHPPGNVQAVEVREVHVQQDQLHRVAGGREFRQQAQRRLPVGRRAGQGETVQPAM